MVSTTRTIDLTLQTTETSSRSGGRSVRGEEKEFGEISEGEEERE